PNFGGEDHNRIQKRDAQGNWSVIATRGDALGQVGYCRALAVDAAGNLYVAEYYFDSRVYGPDRIQKRDAQGNWSVIPLPQQSGEVLSPAALAVDSAGDLYLAETHCDFAGPSWSHFQKRDIQGRWSAI